MSVSSEAAVVTETVRAELLAPLDGAMVLRAFDGLRRRLAQGFVGSEGISIGYDALQIDHQRLRDLDDGAPVEVVATVLGTRWRAHEVEYVANAACGHRVSSLVVARGWTQVPPPDATA